MIQTPLSIALTLWDMGIVADRNLIAWAETQILEQDRPADDLLEVAAQGAAACLKQGSISTVPLSLGYSDQFCIRAYILDLDCDRAVTSFIVWVSQNCYGSAEIPAASLGYHLNHLYSDCEDIDAAILLLRAELPKIMPHCESFAVSFLEPVPDLVLCKSRSDSSR